MCVMPNSLAVFYKSRFANGTTNGTTTAVAPAGFTLPEPRASSAERARSPETSPMLAERLHPAA